MWFPLNYLVIESLHHWDDWFGEDFTGRIPDRLRANGSGCSEVAGDLARRLVGIWLPDADGRRPVYGAIERFRTDPEWRDLLLFHEYFHGDTGAGIGASHQTGWTGLVAHLLCRGGILEQLESEAMAATTATGRPGAHAVPPSDPRSASSERPHDADDADPTRERLV